MKNNTEVIHPNGYKGILYGNSSMVVLKDDKELLHTGFTKIKTKEELYKFLESFPEFYEMLIVTTDKYLEGEEDENI